MLSAKAVSSAWISVLICAVSAAGAASAAGSSFRRVISADGKGSGLGA